MENFFAVGCHHFVDSQGNYLGSFVGVDPPEGSIEVPSQPLVTGQTWTGSAWVGMDAVIAKQATLAQIAALEGAMTDRRVREAILGTDNGWMANLQAQITSLRKTL